MSYVKIVLRGEVYGPLHTPVSLRIICAALKISTKASPTLQSIDRVPHLILVDLDACVESGLYELLMHPGIPYEDAADQLPLQTLTCSTASSSHTSHIDPPPHLSPPSPEPASHSNLSPVSETLPLNSLEMDVCIKAMLHLISAIPSRYIKYNKVLSQQLDRALLEVDRLQESLSKLHNRMPSPLDTDKVDILSLPLSIHTTFIQYRIVQVLYETWKTVGRRYSPAIRTFNIHNIHMLHSVDVAEHYLNVLCSWRRILDTKVWDRLTQSVSIQKRQAETYAKTQLSRSSVATRSKIRLLGPLELPSGKYPHEWEYLVQPPDKRVLDLIRLNSDCRNQSIQLDAKTTLREFRHIFIQAVLCHSLFKDAELVCLLDELIPLHSMTCTPLEIKCTAGTDGGEEPHKLEVTYPHAFIRESICREFSIHEPVLDTESDTTALHIQACLRSPSPRVATAEAEGSIAANLSRIKIYRS
ncbi:hypothetical protein BASA50_002995 [Batrachochytrium salamandrivorans]|uniref:Uncharacterized protein n=1 Tax=Batrachochytrium salamandrivorans TaxID=1357716 RepID=A0ABQ8FJP8_9FUNG|nr:hypothetical protein BASA50_002995 [Batrachochytrium salamandrivorans]KAH9276983.1 hypothetical protein BASA83_000498 [Batrachochytrium salamandrivorans]